MLEYCAADHAENDILMKRSADGGRTWSPMQVIREEEVAAAAQGLLDLSIGQDERVAVYLPKQPETVFALFPRCSFGF